MKNIPYRALTLLIVVVLFLAPLPAYAEDAAAVRIYSSAVIITEVQTGAASAGDEFVELYNVSPAPVDLSGWQVRYVNASAASRDTTLLAEISQGTILPARSYYVLHSDSVVPDTGLPGQSYTPKLSAADKAVALFAPKADECILQVKDAVAWGTSLDGEGQSLAASGSSDRLLQRNRDSTGLYTDVDNNYYDWQLLTATRTATVTIGGTPGTDNPIAVQSPPSPLSAARQSQLQAIAMQDCELPVPNPDPSGGLEPPQEEPPVQIEPDIPQEDTPQASGPSIPAADIGLGWPQITELLPNPAKPQTDADDEFVELYNANDANFDLSGFILQAGKRKYVFPAGTIMAPHAFRAFFSGDTHLAMTNSGGQAALFDPMGNLLVQTAAYSAAKDGQSWSLANGKWLWSTAPTPNAANTIRQPQPKQKTAAKSSTKTAAVKSASTNHAASTSVPESGTSLASQTTARNPIHPGVLALVGVFALLYGAYEYRNDVANKLYQLRRYREARREARQGAKGR